MALYQYYIQPCTPQTNARLAEIPDVEIYDEIENIYSLPDVASVKLMLKIKDELAGTGGRVSQQPIAFKIYRRKINEYHNCLGDMTELNFLQIAELKHVRRQLKPKYLQVAGQLLRPKNLAGKVAN